MSGPRSVTIPVKPPSAEAFPRKWEALRHRARRMTYRAIGDEMGVSSTRAHQYVMEAVAGLKADLKEAATEVLMQELAALDEIAMRAWAAMDASPTKFSLEGLAGLRFTMERRARYLGLDAPVDQRIGLYNLGGDQTPVGDVDLASLSVEDLEELEKAEIARGRIMMKARKLIPAGLDPANEVQPAAAQ